MLLETVIQFLSAIAIGGLIGVERELVVRHKTIVPGELTTFGGVRTFMLISLFGALSVYFSLQTSEWGIFLIAGISTVLLIIMNYVYNLFFRKESGATTEIAGCITFILGGLCASNNAQIATIIGIVITAILLSKRYFSTILEHFQIQELYSTLIFAGTLFIVLPLLPNHPIDQWGIINPQSIWYIVILISGISYVGYFASKIFGTTKGILLSGIFGGLASSTAVTSTMAEHSVKNPHTAAPFVVSTLIASTMMFMRVFIVVATFYRDVAYALFIPLSIMTLASCCVIGYYYYAGKKAAKLDAQATPILLESPFQLLPAIKFAGFFVFISALSHVGSFYFGDSGTYIISLVAGLADVDAISITLASQALSGDILLSLATKAIILAVITNTIVKIGLAFFFGSKKYFQHIFVSFLIVLLSGGISLFFI